MEHSERILRIIEEHGFTEYRVARDIGISMSLFSQWKKNPSSNIYSSKLVLIADYLGCSVDYLLGRTEDPETHQLPKPGAPGEPEANDVGTTDDILK